MNQLKVLFWLRKTQKQKNLTEEQLQTEKLAIYCRITINGIQPSEISTGETIQFDKWINGRACGKREADVLNNRLDNIKIQIKDVFNKLEEKALEGERITSKMIADAYNGKSGKTETTTLISIFEAYIKDCEDLQRKDELSESTITKKKSVLENIKLFIKDKYQKPDIAIDSMLQPGRVEFAFAYDFMHWGKTKTLEYKVDGKNYKKPQWEHNHCAKQLGITYHAIDYAVIHGLIIKNPLYKKVPAPKKGVAKCLTPEDVIAIENKNDFNSEVVSTIKDIFLFSCYTGLAFAEVKALKPDNLTIMVNDENKDKSDFTKHWLFIGRQKTLRSSSRECKIPLLQKAFDILEKYNDHPVCINRGVLLPVITNQKYNEYLKTIQNLCGIKQNLTTHIARHTCSRMFLDNGFSKDFVAQMFGHATTKYIGTVYGEITTRRMSREMEEISKQSNVSFI